MKDKTFGGVIGRFQTPELTDGHYYLLKTVERNHDQLVVFVGHRSSPPTRRNPLSYETRVDMLKEDFPNAIFVKLPDQSSNTHWTELLDAAVDKVTNGAGITFYAGRDSFAPFYSGKYKIETVEFGIDFKNATELREIEAKKVTYSEHEVENKIFRAGIINAVYNQWHRQYHTVDMALVKTMPDLRRYLCLVKKAGDPTWHFPGGFCDKGEKYAESAAREMLEETGLVASERWRFVDDFIIDDWRTSRIEGVDHKTVLMFSRAHQNAVPVAADDVVEAEFVNIEDLLANYKTLMTKNHQKLFESLVEYLQIRNQ